jgi:hypothetical protein
MSYIVLGRHESSTFILDTEDLVTDTFTASELKRVQALNIKLEHAKKSTFSLGLVTNENSYRVYLYGYDNPLYEGKFQETNDRGSLFGFDIEIADYNIINSHLVIVITAKCWCNYNIEVPLVLCQVLIAPITNLKSINLCCITSEPIYFSHSNIFQKQYKACDKDFPNKFLESDLCCVRASSKGLSLFGVVYNNKLPKHDNLNSKLNFKLARGA